MKIQVNTGNHIEGAEALATTVETTISGQLRRFADRITRVEVHLSDENSVKGGNDDKRCMIEVRLERHAPLAVTQHAPTMRQAVDGAATKAVASLESTLGRIRRRRVAPAAGASDDARSNDARLDDSDPEGEGAG